MKKLLNKIHLSDNIKFMKKIDDKKIDLIFADPPYNMQLNKKLLRYNGEEFNGVNDEWDKFTSLNDYDKFCKKWIFECLRILKDNGSMWVIGSYHNIHRLGYILQNMKTWIINEIIWEKHNPVPNFLGTRFVNSQETLLWVTKSKKSKFTFNYKTMKKINNGKQMKSVWKIPISNGNERLKDKNGLKVHSTQKPLKLLEWIILSSSNYGDVVLDPFAGTSTTAHAAKKWGRKFICIEKEKKYINHSINRINKVEESQNKFIKFNLFDEKPPKVTFLDLIKKNYLSTLDIFILKDFKYEFSFKNNGKILYFNEEFSPNLLMRRIYQKPMNAWSNLIIKKNGKKISYLREKFRKEILKYKKGSKNEI